MFGGEGYMKDLLWPEDAKMLVEFHCHSHVTHTSHHFLSYSQVINPL
jgi:hypothetical protein